MTLDNDLQDYAQKKAFKITKASINGKITAEQAQEALKRIDDISLDYIGQRVTLKEAKKQIDNVL